MAWPAGKRHPYKFTAAKRELVLAALRDGQRRYQAMQSVGMHGHMISWWIREDPTFAAEVEQAEAEAHEIVENALFESARSGNVAAAIFYLCNRKPDFWKNVQRQDVVAAPSGAVAQINNNLTLRIDVSTLQEALIALRDAGIALPGSAVVPLDTSQADR